VLNGEIPYRTTPSRPTKDEILNEEMEIKKFILEAVRQGRYEFLNHSASFDDNSSTQGNTALFSDTNSDGGINQIIGSIFKNTAFEPS